MDDDYNQRFGGIARLYGVAGAQRLRASHACVIGVGGVGSWVVEALARTGVGEITMIDLDDVCITNVNRQLPALTSTVGQAKVSALASRVQAIHPECVVHPMAEFLTPNNADRLLETNYSCVVECVDRFAIKALIIARCLQRNLPVITVGGAGGRRDPSKVRVADLNRTEGDRLLRQVRKQLRKDHVCAHDRRKKCGVPAVFSDEPQVFPWGDGTCRAVAEPGENLRMDCASGYGAAAFVTGAFGFVAAAEAVRLLVSPG